MRVTKLAGSALVCVALIACASISPQASPLSSVPGASVSGSAAPASASTATSPGATASVISTETSSPTAAATPMVTPKPSKAPKPTKKPTPSPSATPEGTPADLEVSFEMSTIPDPFYNNTDYTIRVYVSALGTQNLPFVHVKMVAKNEGATFEFDTDPIAISDNYYHDITSVNLPAIGPSTLTLTGTLPSGYYDTNKSNNTKSVDVTVSLAP